MVAALLGASSLAYAQDDVVVEGADGVILDESETDAEQEGEVIVVTGSAIERKDLTTTAPLAVVTKTELDAAGMASVGDILQNLPSQSNAINVNFNNGGDGSTRVSLRGLGAGRSLVLVNGRRHVAGGTGANSSVDLNAIPLAVIERVEVLKDGASAIYGSDAIGGVVNIITRKNFEGTEATGYYGSTADGLASVYDISVAAGVSNDKGNVVFSAGYFQQNPMFAGDREYSSVDKSYLWQESTEAGEDIWEPSGSSAPPWGLLIDYGEDVGNAAWDEVANGSCSSGFCRLDTVTDFRFPSGQSLGDLYNYQPENYLVTPQTRYNVYSAGSYKLTDSANAFFEASYMNRQSDQRLAPTPLFIISEGIAVDPNNYYNPWGRAFIDVRRRMVEAGPRRFFQDLDTFRLVTGFEGKLSNDLEFLKGWRWNMAYNYGRTAGKAINEGRFIRSRVANALGPSTVGADGTPQCVNGGAECVPLNLFGGEGTITQEMIDYISYTGISDGRNEMNSWTFNTSGRLLSTPWGGDIALATGFEYRTEAGSSIPDPMTASGDTTGNKTDPTAGSYNVYEAYGELSIVPVVGKPLAEWLELNLASRTSSYNTFGRATTYKGGLLWRHKAGLSVRGTYSTAFRAPTIASLYSGQFDSFPNVTDPCDTSQGMPTEIQAQNCAADGLTAHQDPRTQLRARIGGNQDLDPETANIMTAGVVYEPTFLKGLAFTVDYWNIAIDNAITTKGSQLILDNCYGSLERTDCDLVQRGAGNLIENITDTLTNVGGNDTSGVDFSIRYGHNTKIGRFRHNLEGTWLNQFNLIEANGNVVEGKGVYDLGVYPAWRVNYATLWGKGAWGAGINMRYIHSFRECEDNVCEVQLDPETNEPFNDPETGEPILPLERDVKLNFTGDIFATYTAKTELGTTRLTLGMNNVLSQNPSVIYNGFLATSDAATYDFLGRYVYARLVQQF